MTPRAPIKRSTKGLTRKQTRRQRTVYGIAIKGQPCAYCGAAAVNGDHVVPRSLVRHYNQSAPEDAPSIPGDWLEVVPSCFACNILKGTRRLIPLSWANRRSAMNAFFGGTPWRVWHGTTDESAFREVHK